MYFRLVTFLFIFFTAARINPVQAQDSCTSVLSGKVIDEHDGQPLPFSNIYIKELGKGAISDTTGFYSIKGLCNETYIAVCSHVGCEPVMDTIRISGHTVHNFFPEHHAEMLEAIVVMSKKMTEQSTLSEQTLSKKELEEMKGQSLGQGLAKVSGVTLLSTGNNIAKPVIHGLHSNRILILNNEVRQEGQQWGNEHAPEIDPFIADQLTVVKGANSVRYGPDAIAGVILVKPKPLRDSSGIGGEFNLGGFSNGRQGVASAFIDGNFRKIPALSWRIQGTYKQAGNVHAPDYFLKNTGLKEYNLSWAAGYQKHNYGIETFYSQFNTDIAIFSASHIGNLTDLQNAFEAKEPLETSGFSYEIGRPRQHIEHELFKAKAYLLTGNISKVYITYARQYNKRFEYDKHKALNDSLAALDLPALQFEITTHTTDLVWEHNRIKSFKGSLGVSGIMQGNTYEGRFFIPNFRKYGTGIFLIERWKPYTSKLELEAGIRFDYIRQQVFLWQGNSLMSPLNTYNNTSGSLGGIYHFNNKLSIRTNAGTAWRPPNVNELYSKGVHHGAAAVETGDATLVREQTYNLTASVQYVSQKLSLHVDAYYNYFDNFIYLKPETSPALTIRGAFPAFSYSQVEASIKGIDFTLNYELPLNFNFTSNASLLDAFNQTAGEYLVSMPANRYEQILEYKFSNSKKLKDTYLSLAVLHVEKQWRVADNSDFVPPPEGYTLLNFQVSSVVTLWKQNMTVGIGINNLLNTTYRDYMDRFRYYADGMGQNISLRLKIPFDIVNRE